MTKKNLTFVLMVVVVAGVVAVAVATSVFGGSGNKMNHTMPNGQMMNGQSMGSDAGTGSGSHTMSNGQSMSGGQMGMGGSK